MQDAIIIGAGLAGLCCANRLHEEGLTFTVLEASDAVGGRIRTDEQDGFLLDRGFQVFSSAYPEAQIVLDYENLQLKMFKPGSLVWDGIRFNRVTDIWRIGLDGIETVLSPFLPFMDKIRMELLRQKVLEGSLEELFSKPNEATIHRLKRTYH
ncbi:NAD(P)-binding protein, partial [bacterium]|nr:NAD(P)-binding protein [bacterium]